MKIIEKVTAWLDERTGLKQPLIAMATHLVPPGAKWSYVFGTAVMTSFIVQVISGIALSTLYVPSAGEAHESIWYITTQAMAGKLLRGMHYFGASAMVLFVGIHALRVFLTGSYKFPRELNWVTGVILLFLTVAMGFTGQVLRWDQTAIWTVAVGTEQALKIPYIGKLLGEIFLSGGTIGGATLSHFFALHVFVFPALLVGLIGLHLYLVFHNGISEPPKVGEPVDPATYREKYESMLKRTGRPFWPHAAWRDIVFSTIVVSGILALAVGVGPPHIEKPPDPSLIKAEPRPDWYLIWYFAMLALLPHRAEDWIIILFPIFLFVSLLVVPFLSNKGERSIRRRPWALASVVIVIAFIGALWHEGSKEPWVPNFEPAPLTQQIIGAASGPIYEGAQVFDRKGCLYCHTISEHGGTRGPDLTDVSNRLTHDQLVIRIVNGGYNMPPYAGNITPEELENLTVFLESRRR